MPRSAPWLTHLVGRPLAILSFRQQRVEADFRYALVRVRENMENIALYRGEEEEGVTLRERFGGGDRQLAADHDADEAAELAGQWVYARSPSSFPIVVAAPRYFAGAMQLGGLMQTVGSFGQVQRSMSWFVDSYASAGPMARDRRTSVDLPPRDRQGAGGNPRRLRCQRSGGRATCAAARCDHEPAGRDETAGPRGPDTDRRPFDRHHRPVPEPARSTLFRVLAGIWPFGAGRGANFRRTRSSCRSARTFRWARCGM